MLLLRILQGGCGKQFIPLLFIISILITKSNSWQFSKSFFFDTSSHTFLTDAMGISGCFDGTNFLLTWHGRPNEFDPNKPLLLYGARMSQNGQILDMPSRTIVGMDYNIGFHTTIQAADRSLYYIIWQGDDTYYFVRMTGEGDLIDPQPKELFYNVEQGVHHNKKPSGAKKGAAGDSVCLFLWTEFASPQYMGGKRISKFGEVLDSIPLIFTKERIDHFAICYDGSSFFVTWNERRHNGTNDSSFIFAQRVSQSGAFLYPAPVLVNVEIREEHAFNYENEITVAASDTTVLVSWFDKNRNIAAKRVSRSGTVIDQTPRILSNFLPGFFSLSSIYTGKDFFVLWSGGIRSEIQGAKITTSGEVSQLPLTIPYETATLDIVPGDTLGAVIWTCKETWNRKCNFHTRRIDYSGRLLDDDTCIISYATNQQDNPKICLTGSQLFAVWEDDAGGHFNILGRRFSLSGDPLDPQPFYIAKKDAAHLQSNPQIISTNRSYCVLWYEQSKVHSRLFDLEAQPVDTDFVVPNGGRNISAVAGDTNYYAVTLGMEILDLDIRVISPAGRIVETYNISVNSNDEKYLPKINRIGDTLLLSWATWIFNTGARDVQVARVTPQGVLLDSTGIMVHMKYMEHAIVSGKQNFLLILWDETGIYAKKIPATGPITDTVSTPILDHSHQYSHAFFDGRHFRILSVKDASLFQTVITPQCSLVASTPLPLTDSSFSDIMGAGDINNKFVISYNTFIKELEGRPVYNWRCKSWLYDDQALRAGHHSKMRDKLKCTLIQKGANRQLTLHITGISKIMRNQRIHFGFYDCRGRLLYSTSSILPPGTLQHTIRFDRNRIGVLSPGVHVIHIRSGNLQQTVKAVIMR